MRIPQEELLNDDLRSLKNYLPSIGDTEAPDTEPPRARFTKYVGLAEEVWTRSHLIARRPASYSLHIGHSQFSFRIPAHQLEENKNPPLFRDSRYLCDHVRQRPRDHPHLFSDFQVIRGFE